MVKLIKYNRQQKGYGVVFGFCLVLFLFTPLVAHQAIVECQGLSCSFSDLLAIPINIFNYLLTMAALIFLLVIVFAGIRMVMYWANEQPEQELMAAKLTLTRGIVGFVIIATAILVINILAITILGLYPGSPIRDWLGGLLYFES